MNEGYGTFLLHDTTMLSPSAIRLLIQMGQDERLVGRGGRLPRVAFAGRWKAQGRDSDHALELWVALTRGEARKLREQTVVGRKMDNERVSPPLQ